MQIVIHSGPAVAHCQMLTAEMRRALYETADKHGYMIKEYKEEVTQKLFLECVITLEKLK